MPQSAILAGNLALIVLALAATALPPSGDAPIAVIASPFAEGPGAVEVVAAAGGSIIAAERRWLAVAASSDPGFVSRLYRSGAALVLNARIASLCRSPS